jgi:SAM-dependent methyltransferase
MGIRRALAPFFKQVTPAKRDVFYTQIQAVEHRLKPTSTRAEALKALRVLSLEEFGRFMISLPDTNFPKLSAVLPRMASEDTQKGWTGASGPALLAQSLDFVNSAASNYADLTQKDLRDATILDYGCGYGRLSRLMYYFVDEAQYFGVDPWDRSIEICNSDGLTDQFMLSNYLPTELPVGATQFDFIFAFSVFTHLSERATKASIDTLTRYLTADGILLITTREMSYWAQHFKTRKPDKTAEFEAAHQAHGFAFRPHARPAIDGDVTYGDTSMTQAWFEASFPSLEVVRTDRAASDPFQTYWFLKKRP